MDTSNALRAFVVGPYLPHGGALMAYHIGRILQLDFNFQAVAVRMEREAPQTGVFQYDPAFPSVPLAEMEATIREDDVLIVNPSFSKHMFGLRLQGRKICYVQGFTTFAVLDCRFQRYVAVSEFVAGFLRAVYGLSPNVIAPFVSAAHSPVSDWWSRPAGSTLIYLKGAPAVTHAFLERLHSLLGADNGPYTLHDTAAEGRLPHSEMLNRIAGHRYLLALSIAEGFGLVPLEAMALGTAVVGFDGFGGRDYMRPGRNCRTVSYPDIEAVAEHFQELVRFPERAAELARAARATARHFSYERFRASWIAEFSDWLQIDPVSAQVDTTTRHPGDPK